jgi:hypothetical protein
MVNENNSAEVSEEKKRKSHKKRNHHIRRDSADATNPHSKQFRPIELAPEFVELNFDIEKGRLQEAARMKKLAPYLHASKKRK